MRKLSFAVTLVTSFWAMAGTVLAQKTDLNPLIDQSACKAAISRFESVTKEYKRAKFTLDRATQLLASARYSSRVGKMNIDLASRQADMVAATSSYVESLGPAYVTAATLTVDCSNDKTKKSGIRLVGKINLDVNKFLSEGVDKLADDQMADIKKLFDGVKSRQK